MTLKFKGYWKSHDSFGLERESSRDICGSHRVNKGPDKDVLEGLGID